MCVCLVQEERAKGRNIYSWRAALVVDHATPELVSAHDLDAVKMKEIL